MISIMAWINGMAHDEIGHSVAPSVDCGFVMI